MRILIPVVILLYYQHHNHRHGNMVSAGEIVKVKKTTVNSTELPGLKYIIEETRFKKYAGISADYDHFENVFHELIDTDSAR